MKGTIVKINKTKSLFCEKIDKIDKSLARFIKKKREKMQINRNRNEKEVTTGNSRTKKNTIIEFKNSLNGLIISR